MLTFMFGVLGSIMFWVVYGIISLFIGTFLLKRHAEDAYYTIKHSDIEVDDFDDFCELIALFGILFFNYVCWPIIALWYIMIFAFKLIFKTLLLNGLKYAITFADKATPEISIKIGKKE